MSNESKQTAATREAHRRGYRVTDDGTFTTPHSETVKLAKDKGGYLVFSGIYLKGRGKAPIKVHRLAAYQKFGEAIFEPGIVVRHLNGNPQDNSVDNIAIGTHLDNRLDISQSERSEIIRKGHVTRGPDGRRAAAQKRISTMGRDALSAAVLKGKATLGRDRRRAIARKACERRRKLTPGQVLDVLRYRAEGDSQPEIGRKLNMSPGAIWQILAGRTYSDITGIKSP